MPLMRVVETAALLLEIVPSSARHSGETSRMGEEIRRGVTFIRLTPNTDYDAVFVVTIMDAHCVKWIDDLRR
ncbi:hypothetical protein JOB18_038565 [Solea senegalensis]|uniref:Uncharacterized protein n=1 Tax=Solea senegalensis TaxID=28829 RepID=A0AAV6TAW7_SOLSE|nr:hypothetical protein JOB18_038565 [Solea senegalensis]